MLNDILKRKKDLVLHMGAAESASQKKRQMGPDWARTSLDVIGNRAVDEDAFTSAFPDWVADQFVTVVLMPNFVVRRRFQP